MRERENILALDLASRFGWCEGRTGVTPVSGSVRCAPEGAATPDIFAGYILWLSNQLINRRPDVAVYEAPLATNLFRGKTTVRVTRILFGLAAITEGICFRMGVMILEADIQDVRGHFISNRRLKSAQAKLAVQDRCRLLGYPFADDNAADACALWDYTMAMRNPRHGANANPLFGGVRL